MLFTLDNKTFLERKDLFIIILFEKILKNGQVE